MSYNIVLIGKTGNGLSSTGNTILKKEIFDTFDSAISGTVLPEKKSSWYNNYTLHVYDTPGLFNSMSTEKEDKERARTNMDLVVNSARILAAFVLVYRYNAQFKFTREDSKTIDILKEFFGETFLGKHGIIVVTRGDFLDIPQGETEDHCFNQWCSRQNSKFKQLINEVNNRILLVSNIGDFSEGSKRLASSERILEMVVNLQSKNEVYTKEEYEALKPKCSIL